LLEQVPLTVREVRGHIDGYEHPLVASADSFAARHAPSAYSQHRTGLRARGHPNLCLSFERRYVDVAAKRGSRERDCDGADDVVAIAPEHRMGSNANRDLEIARSSIGPCSVPGTADALCCTLLDPGGDLDFDRIVGRRKTLPAARQTYVVRDATGTPAARARPLDSDGQDTLLHARATAATARRAKLGLGPGPRMTLREAASNRPCRLGRPQKRRGGRRECRRWRSR
jgi:hypothetical protein